MRLIGHLPAEADARRFVDYLVSRRVAAHAEEDRSGQWQIWIENDDLLDAGRSELEQFRTKPNAPQYDAAGEAAKVRREEQKAAEKRQRNYRDVRTTLFTLPNGPTPVTFAVIGICVAIFVALNFGGEKLQVRLLTALLFDDPTQEQSGQWAMFGSIFAGQVWRLITPAFVHLGFIHIAFNLLMTLNLGKRIEPIKGSGTMAGLVLSLAVLSCLAQAVWVCVRPFGDHYSTFLGLSGVTSGLFGYCWAVGRLRPYERIGVTTQEAGYIIGWLVICSFGLVGFIANAAHWGGLLAGAAIGALPSVWKRRG